MADSNVVDTIVDVVDTRFRGRGWFVFAVASLIDANCANEWRDEANKYGLPVSVLGENPDARKYVCKCLEGMLDIPIDHLNLGFGKLTWRYDYEVKTTRLFLDEKEI